MAHILEDSPQAVSQAAHLLLSGNIVAVPTETVYGLAAHALDHGACWAIFEAKGRPLEDPLICHVLDLEAAQKLADVSAQAQGLMEHFWPGPLTLVLPKKPCIPDLITAGRPTVALRSPAHPLMRKVLKASGIPLAAPSANPFGYISPTTAQHVADQLGDKVPLILDGGPCHVGIESTILDLSESQTPRLLRAGPILPKDLEAVLGVAIELQSHKTHKGALPAPGLLERHYSPRCPSSLFDTTPPEDPRPHACLFFNKPDASQHPKHRTLAWLTQADDLQAAARELYSQLRALDGPQHQHLYVQRIPGTGLAETLNERLQRATS